MGFAFGRVPERVQRAIETDNTEALSAAGRKGAEVTNNRKAEKRDQLDATTDRLRELNDAEDAEMRRQANEHIVPIDPEDE